VKEQEIFMSELPLMTPHGTFIINGVERVIVPQLARSFGVFFTESENKGQRYFGAKIIPARGVWIEIESESDSGIYIRIDKKRKFPATALLRAMGYETDEMILKAVSQAQINPADKSVSYYDDIGNYNRLADYNDQMLRDRNAYVLYPEGQGYDWQWSSVAQRQAFKDLKFKRNLYSQFTIYALGAITINHMISAIDVVWLNRSGINLRATPIVGSNSPGVALTLTF